MKKRQKVTKRMVPFPFVPKTILEEEEEEEVPIQRRTQLARAMEKE